MPTLEASAVQHLTAFLPISQDEFRNPEYSLNQSQILDRLKFGFQTLFDGSTLSVQVLLRSVATPGFVVAPGSFSHFVVYCIPTLHLWMLSVCDWECNDLTREMFALIAIMRWTHMGTISLDAFARAAKVGFITAYATLSFEMRALLV